MQKLNLLHYFLKKKSELLGLLFSVGKGTRPDWLDNWIEPVINQHQVKTYTVLGEISGDRQFLRSINLLNTVDTDFRCSSQ